MGVVDGVAVGAGLCVGAAVGAGAGVAVAPGVAVAAGVAVGVVVPGPAVAVGHGEEGVGSGGRFWLVLFTQRATCCAQGFSPTPESQQSTEPAAATPTSDAAAIAPVASPMCHCFQPRFLIKALPSVPVWYAVTYPLYTSGYRLHS
jgi:hypothetical protein